MFDYKLALQQLTHKPNPYNVLSVMIGAKEFIKSDKEDFIQFQFAMCKKASICRLQYDSGLDLYNMVFSKIKRQRVNYCPGVAFYNQSVETVKEFKGLVCDQLKEVFEEFTGLCLTLF